MASRENTAINDLIARSSGGQTRAPSGRMAATTPQTPAEPPPRVPPSPGPHRPVSLSEPSLGHTTLPVTMPVAAPFEAHQPTLPTSYPVVARAAFEPPAPTAAPVPIIGPSGPSGPSAPLAAAYSDPPVVPVQAHSAAGAPWAEQTQLVRSRHRERFVGTIKVRHSDLRVVVGKVVLPMVLLVIAGIGIGGYFVFYRAAGKLGTQAVVPGPADPRAAANPAPTPAEPVTAEPTPAVPAPVPAADVALAPAANVAPAPAANVEPAPAANVEPSAVTPSSPDNSANPGGAAPAAPADTTAGAPLLVDVRIDSIPSGATVTMVDRGKSQFVGKTPVSAALDASREYDLMFTFPNKATQLEHLNPKTNRHMAITQAVHASPAKPADGAPRRIERPSVERAVSPPARKVSPRPAPESPAKKADNAADEPALGEGTLMISSKPPCEIIIDGNPTGLTTPQRSITLPAGNHKVTLVNSEKDVKKTVSVQITPNATEKVIEDLMP